MATNFDEITGCSALETHPHPLDTVVEEPNGGGSNPNRRSLSIFSRRGTATPKPAIERMPDIGSRSIPNVGRRTSTMFRNRKQPAQIPEGTILRAVPPATNKAGAGSTRALTTLELEMATSPNEEILSAIGSPSASASPVTMDSPLPAVASSTALEKKRSQPLRSAMKRTRGTSNPVQENVIGVWKEGQTQWVQDFSRPATRQNAAKVNPATAVRAETRPVKPLKPQIRVIIPNYRLNAPLPSLPFMATPTQHYGTVEATISAGADNTPSVSTPRGSICRTTSISQVSSISPTAPQPQPQRRASLMTYRPNDMYPSPNEQVEASPPLRKSSSFSEGSSSNNEDDNTSYYSRSARSSVTSLGSDQANNHCDHVTKRLGQRTGSQAFSIISPAAAGIYDDASVVAGSPSTRPTSIFELPGSTPTDKCTLSRASSHTLPHRNLSSKRMSSRRGTKLLSGPPSKSRESAVAPSPSLADAEADLESALTALSVGQATDSPVVKGATVAIAELPAEPVLPPPVPAKSKRRSTAAYRQYKGPAVMPAREVPKSARALAERSRTMRERRRDYRSRSRPSIRTGSGPSLGSSVLTELPEMEQELEEQTNIAAKRDITAQQAEQVIKQIMESLTTLIDLQNTSLLNKGFHRVYKRHEMKLLRAVLKNASPAAWEFMETARSCLALECEDELVLSAVDFTPASFMTTFTQSQAVLAGLKNLMHDKCEPFMRSSTFQALVDPSSAASERIDTALWRIWTFCRVFGSDRGREADIIGQRDWLNGGFLAHQQTCTSTIVSSDSFGMSDVLLNAPDYFGRGNGPAGLDAEELYDMTELWNCMKWLVEALEGRTDQARRYGVFDNTDVRGGDIDGEEAMLEEYASYILTLGLEPVFVISSALHPGFNATLDDQSTSSYPFELAQANGWTRWTAPPPGASNCQFLKESLTRLYEDRIRGELSDEQQQASAAKKEEMKEVRRQRGKGLAQEIMRSRQNSESDPGHLRPLKLTDERPMSDWERVLTKLADGEVANMKAAASTSSNASLPGNPKQQRQVRNSALGDRRKMATLPSMIVAPQLLHNKEFGPSAPSSSSPGRPPSSAHSSSPSLLISPSTSLSDIHPAFRSEVEHLRAASRGTDTSSDTGARSSPPSVTLALPKRQTSKPSVADEEDFAPNTADKAVEKIVEMGFSPEQARFALMRTDMGDGLSVDRAVEMLLRQTEIWW